MILCGFSLGGVDSDIFYNERDEIGEPCVCIFSDFQIGDFP